MALTSSETTQLGCGRDIDEVWEHIGRPPDAHEQDCPYCQAARRDLGALADATHALEQEDADDPTLQASPAVLDHILSVARAEVRRGRRLPLDQAPEGETSSVTVSEQAVAALVRRIADTSSQLQVRRCAVRQLVPPEPHDTGEPRPARVGAELRVSAASDAVIPEAVNVLRAAVIEAVARDVGLDVVTVDVVVEDLHDV